LRERRIRRCDYCKRRENNHSQWRNDLSHLGSCRNHRNITSEPNSDFGALP
jgi:hypothetical protein